MPGTSDVIYLYDGSFEGLLCCVHESVYTHELPVDIQPEEAAQPTLFRQKYIAADEEKAARVYDSIPRKISPDAAALGQCVFLSCMPGKELAILRHHRHPGAGKPPLPHDALSQKILGKHAGDGG